MPARGIHHVDLAVQDVNQSIAFYLAVLGPVDLDRPDLQDVGRSARRRAHPAQDRPDTQDELLRREQQFRSALELTNQIRADIQRTQVYFLKHPQKIW